MIEPILLIITGVMAFIATNLDDIFVLMVFFANPYYNNKYIVLGQYIGVSSLIIISALGYLFKFIIPLSWIGLMGIFPIIIGLKHILDLKFNKDFQESFYKINENKNVFSKVMNSKVLYVAIVSFSNGGDNIGVYVPLFASISFYQMVFIIFIFLMMIGVWCFLGFKMVNNRILGYKIKKYGHLILPFILILLGIAILAKSYI